MRARILIAAFTLFGLATTSSAQSQVRDIPASNGQAFVEQVDNGAPGDFQILALPDTKTFCNPYGGGSTSTTKSTTDFAFYYRPTGHVLIVRTDVIPYSPLQILESFETAKLSPGLTWTALHLDGDGRTDMIAHDPVTGKVVRAYQRIPVCN